MKLNKLSLSLAVTLALSSTFGMVHAATTAATTAADGRTATARTTEKAPAASADKADTAAKPASAASTTQTKTSTTATQSSSATTATARPSTATTAAKTATVNSTNTAKEETLPAGIFSDTKNNWARDAIQAMANAGYLTGYSDNTFKPNQSITREQAATIYGKVLQHNLSEQELSDLETKESGISYSDVASDRWSASSIKLVGAAGVMEGTSKTVFTPNKAMDREEFVASAAQLAKKLNLNAPVKTEKVVFKDESGISKTYSEDINYMAQRGYVASGADVNFNPKQAVTRAQAATILHRMLDGTTYEPVQQGTDKADVNAKDDANKVTPAAKADPKKTESASQQTQRDTEKNVKDDSRSGAAVSEKTDALRSVRPVRRSSLKALDQKQQTALENKVFTELNKTYKTEDAFQDYGVMYWRDNQLHVALKNNSDISTVQSNLTSRGDSTINNYVVVEPSRYSQAEYDAIDTNFRNYYSKNEKAGVILATFPDVENNQLYAVVSAASKETQQGIAKTFGSKVKMVVRH